jgi:hypothetical protein
LFGIASIIFGAPATDGGYAARIRAVALTRAANEMHYPHLRILHLRDLSRGTTEEDLIARAAAVESNSEHPLAKAIVAAAGHRNLTRLAVTNFEVLAGR